MFRIAAMKAFISGMVTGFHLWKRLFGFRPPWLVSVAILSEAYLHVCITCELFSVQLCIHVTHLLVSFTKSSIVSSPKRAGRNPMGWRPPREGSVVLPEP